MIGNLKLAIDRKDWGLVVEFYRQLTGTLSPVVVDTAVVKPTPKAKGPPEPAKKAADDFTMRPSKAVARRDVKTVEEPKQKPKGRKTKQPVKAKQTKFVDTGEQLEEVGADKINDQITPTTRTRKPFKLLKMTCVTCKAVDEVNPILKRDPEMYKCNSCLSKGKINGPE